MQNDAIGEGEASFGFALKLRITIKVGCQKRIGNGSRKTN